MRNIIVSDPYGVEIEYTILSDIEDLLEYQKMAHGVFEDKVQKVMRSRVDPSRWDHLCGSGLSGAMLSGGIQRAHLRGTNPLIEMGNMLTEKELRWVELIGKGHQILVNVVGGYCIWNDSYHRLVREGVEVKVKETVHIPSGSRYINLENDGILEERVVEYLGEKDENYSYVLNLRDKSVDELDEIFVQFVREGGEVVYVYTTGSDVNQMYEYSESAIRCGIKRFEFEFNAGMDYDIIKFLDRLRIDAEVLLINCSDE